MSKKNRRAKAETETAAAVTPAEKAKKQPVRDVRPAVEPGEGKRTWVLALVGVLFFFMVCALTTASIKPVAALLILAALVLMLLDQRNLAQRLCLPALLLLLYVCMDGISTLYALSGKFALYEFLKVAACSGLLVMILAFEKKNGRDTGHGIATIMEVSVAAAALVSIDGFSTGILLKVFRAVMSLFCTTYQNLDVVVYGRLASVFSNANLFAGAAAITILLSLSLVNQTEKKRERWLHLSCLLVTCVAFLLTQSRGAMASLAVAFVIYLLMERGVRKANALVLMVETLVMAVLAAVPCFRYINDGHSVLPMAAVIAGAALLIACDWFVGRRVSAKLGGKGKWINVLVGSVLGLAAVYAALAFTLTGPAKLVPGDSLYREVRMPGGSYSLQVEADGEVHASVLYATKEQAMQGLRGTAYDGPAETASFQIPEDAIGVYMYFSSEEGATLREVRYTGSAEGKVKLRYTLLPEVLAYRMQGAFTSQSYIQRTVYVEDGLKLFKRSPVIGLGMGAFENAAISVQTYHYESKYVHNHYLQCLVDTGVIGLVLYVMFLLACVWALVKSWLKGAECPPMTAALAAALAAMLIHSSNEILLSTNFYLPYAFGLFGLIMVCCGDAAPLPKAEKTAIWVHRSATALLGVFMVLLGLNLYAGQLVKTPTYDNLAKAARIDPYEKNDHMLSFVCSAATLEDPPQYIMDLTAKFEPKLEKANSNTIPYYLAEAYFNTGRTERAFEMLKKYLNYTPSDSDHWAQAFILAIQNFDDTPEFRDGLLELRAMMNDWNEANVGQIELPEELELYLQAYLGV